MSTYIDEALVLGIESTCDETGAAVLRGGKLLSSVVASSMQLHSAYGGVIPETASRAHAEAFIPVVRQSLEEANVTLDDIDAIAVAAGPGLAGCLAVGTSGAKGLALGSHKPLYGVNHVIAHAAVTQLQFGAIPPGSLALIVSGGHTSLLKIDDIAKKVSVIGTTLDDAAGECFDKIARLLGFPYPGGPFIDDHARHGDPHALNVPQGLTQGRSGKAHPYDFSFSGVKTAVARWVEQEEAAGHSIPVDDVCASLAFSVADVISRKALKACKDFDAPCLIVGGGFSANSQLRNALLEKGKKYDVEVRLPHISLCTDNGVMIAALGYNCLEEEILPSGLHFSVDSAMPLSQIVMRSEKKNG